MDLYLVQSLTMDLYLLLVQSLTMDLFPHQLPPHLLVKKKRGHRGSSASEDTTGENEDHQDDDVSAEDSQDVILGLLPPCSEEVKLRAFVKHILTLPVDAPEQEVKSQRGMQVEAGPNEALYARGVLGDQPRTYRLTSWGLLDALMSQVSHAMWCRANFEISGEWPFNDPFP